MRILLTTISLFITVTLPAQEVKLIDFLEEAREHYQVDFSYNHQQVAKIRVQPTRFEASLEQTLQKTLYGSGLGFLVESGTVSLYPSPDNIKPARMVTGLVVDKKGGEALPNAVLKTDNNKYYTVTNTDGRFALSNVPNDVGTIEISYIGYAPVKVSLADLATNPTISLIETSEVLDEVVISDEAPSIIHVAERPGEIKLNARYLNNLSSFGEKDVFRSLQLLPGISGTTESSSNLNIRGSTPDQVLVLFDGFTVYHLDHFFGVFSAFNSHIIKDIHVYKGGFGASYGGRVSSVVDLTGKNGNREKISGQASFNQLSGSAVLEVPINKNISFVVAGRRSFTDVFQSNLFNNLFDQVRDQTTDLNIEDEDAELTTDFYFYDFNSKATWHISPKDLLQFSIYRGRDNLTLEQFFDEVGDDFVFEQIVRQDSEWGNRGESLRYARQWSDRWMSELITTHSVFYRRQRFQEDLFFEDEEEQIDEQVDFSDENEIEEFNFSLNNSFAIDHRHTLDFGGYFHLNAILYRSEFFDEEDLTLDFNGFYTGLFVNHNYRPVPDLLLTGGLRYSYYELTESNYFEPRLSAVYTVNDHLRLKAATGLYNQFVGRVTTFDDSFGQDDFWLLRGIDESPVISSTQFVVGATLNLANWQFDVEAYHKDLDGLSAYTLDSIPSDEVDFDPGELTEGSGTARGIEFLVKRESNNLTSWIGYTLSESTNQFEGIQENETFASSLDQRHELKVVNSYDWKSWNFTLSWIYGSGLPYTPRIVNFDDDEQFPIGTVNSERLPDYHRLDLNISYLKSFSKVDFRINLNLLNLYNRTNVKRIFFLEQFDEATDQLTDRVEQVEMLGFTPSLGIEIKF